ncbi:putative Lipase maturation factor protein [Naja naja]|nr:putative Lipase maturation factor protein [Naja naja]
MHKVFRVGIAASGNWVFGHLPVSFVAAFRVAKDTPPSLIVIWAYRWLVFRIMLGAGMIKIRGDRCWKDLTCMNYHYEVCGPGQKAACP